MSHGQAAMSTTITNDFASDSADRELTHDNYTGLTAQGVSDPVFMYLAQTLTIRELVLLKNVSKAISDLVSTNSVITASVRGEENTMDWYYPLYVIRRERPSDELLWFGLHRPSRVRHILPSYSHFLPSGSSFHPDQIHASVEGLFLMLLNHPNRRSKWRRLVVTNPVTREWRLLPPPNCNDLGFASWNYGSFQLRMVVDNPSDAYKVILIHREWLCVYKSTTKMWTSHVFPQRLPLDVQYQGKIPDLTTEHYLVSSTVVNGRIHFAELQYDNDPEPTSAVDGDLNLLEQGQVIVYEVDDEAGMWKPGVQYKLESYIPSNLYGNYRDYGFRIGSYTVGIVESMGSMYAIIPAWFNTDTDKLVDEEFKMFHNLGEEYRRIYELGPEYKSFSHFGFIQLHFYVLRLKGSVGRPFGQLFIHVPRHGGSIFGKFHRGYFLQHHPHATSHAGYRCFARGNVIWVIVANYMLEYDVLSGQSTTKLLPQSIQSDFLPTKCNVAFTPSLCMKP